MAESTEKTSDPMTLLIESTVRREVQKQVVAAGAGAQQEFKAEHWDFMVDRIEVYPGPGWVFHCFGGMSAQAAVYVVWRMNRVEQAKAGIKPKMPLL